jgi:hypothetical protein
MPARPPQWGLEPWPDDGDEPSAKAELQIRQFLDGDEADDTSDGEEATPSSKTVRRIMTVLRGTRFGAVLRIAVLPEDGSQMIAAMERIMITLIWAAAFTVSLGIVTAAALPAEAKIAIIGLEVVGFAVILLTTRWRRQKGQLGLLIPDGRCRKPRFRHAV